MCGHHRGVLLEQHYAAALEIGRRRNDTESKEPDKINSSRDSYNVMRRHLMDLGHEEFWIILLNQGGKVISTELISKGGLTGTVADPKIIFGIALKSNSSGILLAHNHPSGNLKPSSEDLKITRRLVEGGKLLNLAVLDHIILTAHGFYSFADEGLI